MTTTLSNTGRAIHFPGPLTLGPDGVLTAPPRERLVEIAAEVDSNHLLVFADRLSGSDDSLSSSERERMPTLT